jgi:hypothetical protein
MERWSDFPDASVDPTEARKATVRCVGRSDRSAQRWGVEDQVFGSADVHEKRGRVNAVEAAAGAVGGHGKDLGGVAALDLASVAAGAAFVRALSSPEFQIILSSPWEERSRKENTDQGAPH